MGEVEQEPIKTFFIGEDAFDLPESKVDGFLKSILMHRKENLLL